MNKGISLHIGINKLSTHAYNSEAALHSPANDAKAMLFIAQREGYENIRLLLNEEATKKNFLDHFNKCIGLLKAGDTFLLSFSGHGGQVKDDNGDEKDGMDETWCFYDDCLLDDELGIKWKEFKKGVRIIVVSASCHSRTALRALSGDCFSKDIFNPGLPRPKEIIQNNKSIIESYLHDKAIQASIIHLSACEDAQEARDGNHFSKFTTLLLKHWNSGRFKGNYEDLVQKIRRDAGYLQKAGIATLGNNDPALLDSPPFKLLTNKK